MNRYFDHLNTLAELHAEYKRLALRYHPDMGGDDKTMAEINGQYDDAVKRIKAAPVADDDRAAQADRRAAASEMPAEFRAAILAALRCQGITLELVGRWLWVTGDTYPHKDKLKAAGYHFAGQKKAWYWHSPDDYSRASRKSLDEIKIKYGCQRVRMVDNCAIED